MRLTINNGMVFAEGTLKKRNILIEDGVIAQVSEERLPEGEETLDAAGLTVLPAFFDMHTHLREPGFEYKEDFESGTMAAVHGGYSAVCAMPNTKPVCDSVAGVDYVYSRAAECARAKVYPIAAISKGSLGAELTEIGTLKAAGAIAISDDGRPVENPQLMRLALEYAAAFGMPVISHCEDLKLADGGFANEGYYSTVTGLKGITRAAEELMVAREALLAGTLGVPVHIAHISTRGSVDIVREAKKRGVRITCETCPHYFAGDDSMIENFDPNTKVNPPLRTKDDVEAIVEGLADGTIDAIATDHAPHHFDEKNVEYMYAANGISGLETAFPLSYTCLVETGRIPLSRLVELMCEAPRRILGAQGGRVAAGEPADLVLVDLGREYEIDPADFFSKGKNTPFAGRRVRGEVRCTLVDGEIRYRKTEEKK